MQIFKLVQRNQHGDQLVLKGFPAQEPNFAKIDAGSLIRSFDCVIIPAPIRLPDFCPNDALVVELEPISVKAVKENKYYLFINPETNYGNVIYLHWINKEKNLYYCVWGFDSTGLAVIKELTATEMAQYRIHYISQVIRDL